MASDPPLQPTAPADRARAIGAVCWILSLEFFVGQTMAQAAWRTPYNLMTNFIWCTASSVGTVTGPPPGARPPARPGRAARTS